MDQIWSDYHFLIFLRILVRINAKEFPRISEKWTWDLLEQFCTGTWPTTTTTERRRNKDSFWGDKKIKATEFFSQER